MIYEQLLYGCNRAQYLNINCYKFLALILNKTTAEQSSHIILNPLSYRCDLKIYKFAKEEFKLITN